jgi:alkyl hydroperoxide reductase subunit AhpC
MSVRDINNSIMDLFGIPPETRGRCVQMTVVIRPDGFPRVILEQIVADEIGFDVPTAIDEIGTTETISGRFVPDDA